MCPLGLAAITAQLVEAMGGRAEVTSTPGEGSCFRVVVPAAASAEPTPQAPRVVAQPARRLRLLVVDDNAINRLVAERLLLHLGHHVTLADSGAQALERLQAEPFDAVLMDCHMPGLDGPETTRRYRAMEPAGQRLPIFALTASALREELEGCLAAGMDDTLTKPIRVDQLEQVLASCSPRLAA